MPKQKKLSQLWQGEEFTFNLNDSYVKWYVFDRIYGEEIFYSFSHNAGNEDYIGNTRYNDKTVYPLR